ncbi:MULTISPECIES: bifunctional lysylphosphatidylglycerol flippase/synthetase MprF [Paenibacillus]|uniref:Phosphatidylglycerol lysyltransferase n=1 Tax=Paenibacillus pabuli TaxID=1472 RepID=A0A855XM27_9BACL|nr:MULTISPECIES: bifunctional lysylphosphatidylglycerol flippase/synthetase MprF [Paenibacillus]PWW32698.1 phosphatidylglycerol lysyltransferase [Paenibacillus pabuli]PXV98353.1 phosphatidylglycerol lysyltransferase [Paenibacillus taichungensis]
MKDSLQNLKLIQFLRACFRSKIIRALIPLAILVLIFIYGRHEVQSINLANILNELHIKPLHVLFQLIFASFLAVSVMSTYDFLIRKQFKLDIHWLATFRYAWIANTFNNMVGFAGLTGVGLRTFLYKKSGIPMKTMGAAVLFLSPILLVGLSLLGCLALIGILPVEPVFEKHSWLRYGVWGVALYLPFFLLMQRSSLFAKWFNKGNGKLPWKVVMASVGSSVLEWACAGTLFWLFVFHDSTHLPFPPVFGVYVVAAIAGIISMAPGGIGAFDLIALLGLQTLGVESSRALTILLLFRMFYFVIPWFIGLVLAGLELCPSRKQWREIMMTCVNTTRNTWIRFWSWPSRFRLLNDLGAWLLGKLVFASGVLLLISAASPGLINRLRFMEHLLSLPIMRLSEQLSVIIGVMLIVISRGISMRIRRAYLWTGVLLLAGAVFTFTKGFDYEEALILLTVAFILWISPTRFNRESVRISGKSICLGAFLALILSASYYIVGSNMHPAIVQHLPTSAQQWVLRPHNYALTALSILMGALIVIAFVFTLRPSRYPGMRPGQEDFEKLTQFVAAEDGNLLTHLLYLGDKNFYWAQNDQILIPYSRVGQKLIVLGDPVGNKNFVGAAIQEFQNYAHHYALTVVFYQATPEYLSIYHENGFKFFKLGEEALVPLDTFTLKGKCNQNLRTALNKSEREGQTFEVLYPPYASELLSELCQISDEWLGSRKEKTYSLGWFNEAYIQRSPLTILRDAEGHILAFATLAPSYSQHQVISIDLMRHLNDTPNGTMDVLFVRLIEWAKEQGYSYFNLGMSPLSSVGENQNAHRQEKLARLVFRYGGYWYGFEGLRRYKEKFSPEWHARYLAYPAGIALPVLTIDLIRLVSRQPD